MNNVFQSVGIQYLWLVYDRFFLNITGKNGDMVDFSENVLNIASYKPVGRRDSLLIY